MVNIPYMDAVGYRVIGLQRLIRMEHVNCKSYLPPRTPNDPCFDWKKTLF